MGCRMELLALKVGRESGKTIQAIAAELGIPVEHVVSIALEWFAELMCSPEGPSFFTDWLQDRVAQAGLRNAR